MSELRDFSAEPEVVVQLLDSLGTGRGGLTRAVLKRFRLVSEGRRAIVATVAYQSDLVDVYEQLKHEGSLPPHTELRNFHLDKREFSRAGTQMIETGAASWGMSKHARAVPDPDSEGLVRYFDGGRIVGAMSQDRNGRPRFLEKHDPLRPWVRLYRDTFWPDGTMGKREYFDDLNAARYRIYVDREKRPYISTWVSPKGYEYRSIEHKTETSETHKDMRWANAVWLQELLGQTGQTILYGDEPRTSFAFSIASKSVYTVATIHTTHRDVAGNLKQWMTHYRDSLKNINQVVFFTDAQRKEFIADTGLEASRTQVIPHAAPTKEGLEARRECDKQKRLFVTVSRLADDKQIDHAIRAFSNVVKEFPDAKYRIYGTGPAASGLQKLIGSLGLNESVTLEGQTHEALKVFATASASVLTSRYEGFGMVITESFASGTPVIAYAAPYGPISLVKDKVNGLLVGNSDEQHLSEAMKAVLESLDILASLQEGAEASAKEFTEERWREQWLRLNSEHS